MQEAPKPAKKKKWDSAKRLFFFEELKRRAGNINSTINYLCLAYPSTFSGLCDSTVRGWLKPVENKATVVDLTSDSAEDDGSGSGSAATEVPVLNSGSNGDRSGASGSAATGASGSVVAESVVAVGPSRMQRVLNLDTTKRGGRK